LQIAEQLKRSKGFPFSYLILSIIIQYLRNVKDSICLDVGSKIYSQLPSTFQHHIVTCVIYLKLLRITERKKGIVISIQDLVYRQKSLAKLFIGRVDYLLFT
jgi:hypothetical protein